ncbi:branched-chain amino acid ABC transporter permease [Modestobacter roseus]|uniref:Branched-chain amino acid transport system permease protein n=1 Tax=Modestobacter roseus TaxID=1181884 RepID=A0A562IWN9_9ACTN|nr:branched-chain amino acid ABC transporter permease [Modestobacter roseus]MQA34056.1 branched-chain amino acid ABC transporter permease [Modestobacter roseus]TWH75419.1 branched-chain amino acid transport system permease protein [Modestobacter roseus]
MSDLQSPAAPAGRADDEAPGPATAAADEPTPTGRRTLLPGSTLLRHLLVLAVAAVGAVVLLEITDPFTNSQLATLSYYAIAAGGLTVLTGMNGQISLGHGALMAVGAYTTALFLSAEEPLPLPLILLAAVVVATAVGALVGVAAARLHGPYLAGATLALAVGLPGLAIYFHDLLGGEQGLRVRAPRAPEAFDSFISAVSGNAASNTKWLAYLGAICLLITYFLLANLVHSRIGRTWRAVRDQEVAAELAGIDLGLWRVLAFTVSAAAAGLAGGVLALVVRLAAPSGFTLVLSLSLLTAIVIGGLGSLLGALLGSALLVFLPPFVTDLGSDWGLNDTEAAQLAPFVYGVVLVVVMIFAPAGVVGTVRRRWLTRRATRSAAGPSGG